MGLGTSNWGETSLCCTINGTQSATVGQPGWQQPSPLSQPPNWGQGVV